MNINKRLNAFIELKGMNVREFERKCGLSNGSASKIADNSRKSTYDRISIAFPDLNIDWLLSGKGEMLKDISQPEQKQENEIEPDGHIRYWVDVSATGGSLDFLANPDEHKTKWINVPNFSECTDAVNFWGDSMTPLYHSGEVIILKEWKESFIDYGNVYLVITRNGNRMVKYLRRSTDESKVLCVSENKEFDPFEIDKTDILKLFVVKGSIKKNMT